ncbi:MAG: glycosyltransferase [Pseudomonadota bacterium]
MRIAIVHYWLLGMRGGEAVLEEMIRCYPEADIYTHVYAPERVSPLIRSRPVTETFVGRLPGARRRHELFLPLMPRALEELDLTGYDLVISSESGPAKGVIAHPDATHVCYCHSPMRYLYDHYPQYRATLGPLKRALFSHLAHRLRVWDTVASARVDRFVANSRFVARRIARAYGREASVVHPPVDLAAFGGAPAVERDGGYLVVSQLVPYKRVDIAVEAFRRLGKPLTVAGDGPMAERLAAGAPANVRFLGRVDGTTLRELYARSRALVFPGEEDFGIVPVEAIASGCPVIAYGRGGALDTVTDGETGVLFGAQTAEALAATVLRFEGLSFPAERVAAAAERFSAERFRTAFMAEVAQAMAAKAASGEAMQPAGGGAAQPVPGPRIAAAGRS